MGTIPCKSVRQGASMTIGKWARLLLLAAPVLAGCKGFFDAPAGGGGGGSSTLTSGVFYVLNQATAQIAAYSVVAGVLTPVTGSPYALGTSPHYAVGAFQEGPDGRHGHRCHGVNEQAQQNVFEAAQSDIQAARQAEIAAEGPAAQAPQILRDGPHRAQPAAETLAEEPRHPQECDQQEHRSEER